MKSIQNLFQKLKFLLNDLASVIYSLRGKRAWSFGYYSFKRKFLLKVFSNKEVIELFKIDESLPDGYGYGLDERVVEYPWVLSKLNDGQETILDAGSALNHDFIINQPILGNKNLHILTLAPESRNYLSKGISYLFEDLRAIPIQNDFYDVVISISTIEHIGFDNTFYIQEYQSKEINSLDHLAAIREIKRVLKPGGEFIFTLPYGKSIELSTQLVFNEASLNEIIDTFGPSYCQSSYFRYDQNGWQLSNEKECQEAEVNPWISLLPGERSKNFTPPLDKAAASRAVVCVIMKKE